MNPEEFRQPKMPATFHNYERDLLDALAGNNDQDPNLAEIADETRADVYDYVNFMKTDPSEEEQDAYDEREQSPKLQAVLRGHGIPDDAAKAMAEAWNSYSALSAATLGKGNEEPDNPKDIPPSDLFHGVENKVARIEVEYQAVKDYIEKYGIEELVEVYETFKIVNFRRGLPEEFHDQLERWKNGEAVKHVEAASAGSYNDFMSQEASHTFSQFGTAGTFYFESGGKTDLARIMVSIGKHERAGGREPAVDDVVLSGHGLEDSLEVGFDDLAVEDFLTAAQTRQRLAGARSNTYERHLGNHYRLILNGCLLAGATPDSSPNFAQSLHTETGRPVNGSNVMVAWYEISPDGAVTYLSNELDADPGEQVAATIYSK